MADVRTVVEPLGNDRFAIRRVDVCAGQVKHGPDGGEDYKGYATGELRRRVLRDRYGLSEAGLAETCFAVD